MPLGSHGEEKLCELADRIHHTLGHARSAAGISMQRCRNFAFGEAAAGECVWLVRNQQHLQQRLSTIINLNEGLTFGRRSRISQMHMAQGLKNTASASLLSSK